MFASTLRLSALGLALGLLLPLARADDKPAEKAINLKVGDPAPVFDTVDDQGKGWKAADHYGKKWVVVYFYPGDFTPGCTAQANAFRDAMNKLTDQGVEFRGGDLAAVAAGVRKAHVIGQDDEDVGPGRLGGGRRG